MKTIILYYSKHHGNTRKIVQAAYTAIDADILDISSPKAAKEDLSGYDRIGIASGIYGGSFHPEIGKFCCRGLNTFGPFGFFGGVAKGHPDVNDLERAADFVRKLK